MAEIKKLVRRTCAPLFSFRYAAGIVRAAPESNVKISERSKSKKEGRGKADVKTRAAM